MSMLDFISLGYNFGETCLLKEGDSFTEEVESIINLIDSSEDSEMAKRFTAFGFGEYMANFLEGWKNAK